MKANDHQRFRGIWIAAVTISIVIGICATIAGVASHDLGAYGQKIMAGKTVRISLVKVGFGRSWELACPGGIWIAGAVSDPTSGEIHFYAAWSLTSFRHVTTRLD
jgi:hypothetical protein